MNIGGIFRRLSTENEKDVAEMADSVNVDSMSGITSLFSGPSKLLETVNTKTGHFVSDLGDKLNNIRQASVDKLEHAVRGTVIGTTSGTVKERSGDTLYESEIETPEEHTMTPQCSNAQRSLHNNPFNRFSKNDGGVSVEHDRSKSNERSAVPLIRRQSSSNMPRPPRPPPPTPSALNRAISLDEGSCKNKLKAKLHMPQLANLGSTAEQEEQRDATGDNSSFTNDFASQDDGRDRDSSASEYGVDGDHPIYEPDNEDTSPGEKEGSTGSDDMVELESFLGVCVSALVSGRWSQIPDIDEKVSELFTTEAGRTIFVNTLEREVKLCEGQLAATAVPELLTKINLLLTECQDAEDFKPAKKVLTTSLLFHAVDPSDPSQKEFLFTRIKHLPIWQSLRFWNACFFQSVQEARVRLVEQGGSIESAEKIAHGQLQSYIRTMSIFNLHHNIMQEFLRKHGSLFNLTDDEMQSLQASIDSMN